jgi:hypothetical protein
MIDIVFIIPEITKGMKSFGPKSLINIRGYTLIEHQIELIRTIYKHNPIYLLTGFESERIKKTISSSAHKKNIHFLENKQYDTSSQIASIVSYIEQRESNKGAIFINNGIITRFNFSKMLKPSQNTLFLIKGKKNNFNIGCLNPDKVEYLFYDLPFLWSECLYLTDSALDLVKQTILPHELKTLFLFEMVNKLLDRSIVFNNIYIPKSQITKINNIKDINKAKLFI